MEGLGLTRGRAAIGRAKLSVISNTVVVVTMLLLISAMPTITVSMLRVRGRVPTTIRVLDPTTLNHML